MELKSKVVYLQQAQDNLIAYLKRITDDNVSGIPIGIKRVDNVLTPLSSSDMMGIIARPSNMKTSIAVHYTIQAALSAIASRQQQVQYAPPLYITAETPIEELSIKTLANFANIDSRLIRDGRGLEGIGAQELEDMVREMFGEWPILYFGHSIIKPRRGLITIDSIEKAVYEVTDQYSLPPRLIVVDYLQRISAPGVSDRRLALSEIVERLKDLHMSVGAPLIFGSQARREVDDRPFPVPDSYDGKETGSIEETSDVLISTMRPVKYWPLGSVVPKTSPQRIVTNDLFFLNIIKQRNGIGNEGFFLKFRPEITQLTDIEELENEYEV